MGAFWCFETPGCMWVCVHVLAKHLLRHVYFFRICDKHCIYKLTYRHTSCRWPCPDWRTSTLAAGRDSRRSSCWPRWTRSFLPLHSRRVSLQSIPGLLQSTPPSLVLSQPWSCNNWFCLPPPSKNIPHCYWFNWRQQLNSIAQLGKVTGMFAILSSFGGSAECL